MKRKEKNYKEISKSQTDEQVLNKHSENEEEDKKKVSEIIDENIIKHLKSFDKIIYIDDDFGKLNLKEEIEKLRDNFKKNNFKEDESFIQKLNELYDIFKEYEFPNRETSYNNVKNLLESDEYEKNYKDKSNEYSGKIEKFLDELILIIENGTNIIDVYDYFKKYKLEGNFFYYKNFQDYYNDLKKNNNVITIKGTLFLIDWILENNTNSNNKKHVKFLNKLFEAYKKNLLLEGKMEEKGFFSFCYISSEISSKIPKKEGESEYSILKSKIEDFFSSEEEEESLKEKEILNDVEFMTSLFLLSKKSLFEKNNSEDFLTQVGKQARKSKYRQLFSNVNKGESKKFFKYFYNEEELYDVAEYNLIWERQEISNLINYFKNFLFLSDYYSYRKKEKKIIEDFVHLNVDETLLLEREKNHSNLPKKIYLRWKRDFHTFKNSIIKDSSKEKGEKITIRSGGIYWDNNKNKYFLVINNPCDLVDGRKSNVDIKFLSFTKCEKITTKEIAKSFLKDIIKFETKNLKKQNKENFLKDFKEGEYYKKISSEQNEYSKIFNETFEDLFKENENQKCKNPFELTEEEKSIKNEIFKIPSSKGNFWKIDFKENKEEKDFFLDKIDEEEQYFLIEEKFLNISKIKQLKSIKTILNKF